MLLPKLRIGLADFPWNILYSIDQRLLTSESGCGYRYGQFIKEVSAASHGKDWISDRVFVRIAKAP